MKAKNNFRHPVWSRSASIYEVNIRQFTEKGDFESFREHLPRLKNMGIEILWFMPIHPVGEKNRKGSMGSSYSVKNYFDVNPDFGSLDEFKSLVEEIHTCGMYVIIDWVANHTAWDNNWVDEHPNWYKKDDSGAIHSYIYDNGEELEYWDDVVGLDYSNSELWDAMSDAMKFWVREINVDGFRCDVAGLVPTAFWEKVRSDLDTIKPVFMLAEWSSPELHRIAFDMTYDWDLYALMKAILAGEKNVSDIEKYLESSKEIYPQHAYRMLFTTNHDKNSWDECDTVLYGDAFRTFAVLTLTLPGMPLIYSGQESGLDKRLAFFDKDKIDWKDFQFADFYRDFIRLKKQNPALWNGEYGGEVKIIKSNAKDVPDYP
ncbi:hypothetical protein KAM483_40080 [Aeromonas caviae]|uniref:alpha-amylase family glycosyl hydrolase n=1 Tax=Aeromonas caviae TaxID=648 RepID=UPI001FC8700C|nr:alpha-amylase family glycosyl hydrolase [Aeromonas caviae]GKR89107.1 hypothetical protein KAM483_40080 [Aeromonas caviae]